MLLTLPYASQFCATPLTSSGDLSNPCFQSATQNEDLRALFMYCFGDFGTSPDRCGFQMQATLLGHFWNGELLIY